VKSKNAAAYLESHVSDGLLKSFLVEDKADYDLLFDEMRRKRKLPININIISSVKEIKRPYGQAKMETLKRDYGVIGYLDESFSAPDTVMQALRSFGQVHRVLVGGDTTQSAIDEKGLLDFLSAPDTTLGQQGNQASCIFANSGQSTKKYNQSVSRYSHEISTRIDDISPAKVLAPSNADPALKESLGQQLKDLHNKMNELRPKLADAEKKKADLERQGQQVSERTLKAKEAKERFSKMKQRLTNAIAKENDAAKDLEEDDQSRKRELLQSIMAKVGESIVHLESHAANHEKLMEATYSNAGVRIDRDAVAFKERKITYVSSRKR
jgi:structural maintenance of chromosomes protein 5